jgi:hypothetical protein
MIGGWSGSSSYASALCASRFEPPMVRWEVELDERLKMKNERLKIKAIERE